MKRVLIRKDGDKGLIQTSLQPFHAEVLQFSGRYIVRFHLATHQIVQNTHYVDGEMRRV